MLKHWLILPALGASAALLAAAPALAADDADGALLKQAQGLFKPLPKDMATPEFPITPQTVALGRSLFFDPRISLDGTVSCARCHQPALYGSDGLATSVGVKDRANPRNAPTVLNAALQFVEHWRGDRTSVEDQASKALLGPPSFGLPDNGTAVAKLAALGYRPMFAAAFPGDKNPLSTENWGKAIGAYERTLVTPAPFDAYLAGNSGALPPLARAGLRKFIDTGCSACHNGVGVGGGMYQKFGVTKDYWTAAGAKQIDKGRFDVTHNAADMYVFKVPSLRNVAMTPPYFHDGSVAALPAAVRVMAEVQLGKKLADEDVKEIVAFLDSLTGSLPSGFAAAPELPAAAFAPAPAAGAQGN